MTEPLDKLDCWRALEALRSGVPNRDAVSVLGCSQPRAEERFLAQLGQVAELAKRVRNKCFGQCFQVRNG